MGLHVNLARPSPHYGGAVLCEVSIMLSSVLTGWGLVITITGVLTLAAAIAVRRSVRGWGSAVAVALLSVVLVPVLVAHVFGDVSRLLPPGAFSDGADGKDQIILAGILWTFPCAVSASSILVLLVLRLAPLIRGWMPSLLGPGRK
jgi:hypothetical protein